VDKTQINKIMQNLDHTDPTTSAESPRQSPLVDEAGQVAVSGYIKVFDPETSVTLVEARE
jgi:hypothetical protein